MCKVWGRAGGGVVNHHHLNAAANVAESASAAWRTAFAWQLCAEICKRNAGNRNAMECFAGGCIACSDFKE
jgi:hypothetical protein